MRSSERGYASVFFLCTTPVLLGGCILLVFLAQGLSLRSEMDHICRSHLLKAQSGMEPSFTRLLKVNPLAQALIVRKRLAQIRLAAALASGHPVAIAHATLRYKKVQTQLRNLGAAQKTLIFSSQAAGGKALIEAQFQFQKSINKRRGLFQSWLGLGVPIATVPVPRLAVRKTNPKEAASPYETLPQFEEKQSLTVHWRLPFKPHYFEDFFERSTGWLQMEGKCSATLTKKTGDWVATLKKVKSLWRP